MRGDSGGIFSRGAPASSRRRYKQAQQHGSAGHNLAIEQPDLNLRHASEPRVAFPGRL
jgi:hypothetical protein